MKIAVYTIAKNEASFISRWAESCAEADFRLIVDTGSTDTTVESARSAGITVAALSISPWRFDDARNASLALVPSDIDLCVALDADEVLQPGWRSALERMRSGATRPRYRYVWSWTPDGRPDKTYGGDKIHARHGYRWKHPVHETLRCQNEKQVWVDDLEIHHHPDSAKSRAQYLPLLELAVAEDPSDDRNAFYFARELFFAGRISDAIREFHRHLALPSARWEPERAASMRYLAKCLPADAERWLLRAIAEAPGRREALVELACLALKKKNWGECYWAAKSALAIETRPLEYISDGFAWGYQPHDLAAVSAYWLGMPVEALRHGLTALRLAPSDERLLKNLEYYESVLPISSEDPQQPLGPSEERQQDHTEMARV